MYGLLIATAVSTTFTVYPGFVAPKSQIEMVRDLGPVLEVTVRCPLGAGIMTYSKVERLFCTPDWTCYGNFRTAAEKLCK